MTRCLRNASCRCEECQLAMGMITSKDLQAISSSKIHEQEAEQPKIEVNSKPVISEAPKPQIPAIEVKVNKEIVIENNNFEELTTMELINHNNWKARKVGFTKLTKNDMNLDLFMKLVSEKSMAIQENALSTCIKHINFTEINEIDILTLMKALIAKPFTAKITIKQKAFELLDILSESLGSEVYSKILNCHIDFCTNKLEKVRVTPKAFESSLQCIDHLIKAYGLVSLDKSFSIQLKSAVINGLAQRQIPIRKSASNLAITVNSLLRGAFVSILIEPDETKFKFTSDKQKTEVSKQLEVEINMSLQPTKSFNGLENNGEEKQENTEEEEEMDVFEYLPEKKIMNKISFFFTETKEKKWSIRKDAYKKVINLCGSLGSVKLCASDSYSELMHEVRMTLNSDSNLNVNMEAIKLCTVLLSGLRKGFSKYLFIVLDLILMKLKDKKLTVEMTVGAFLDQYGKHIFSLYSENEKGLHLIFSILLKENHRALPPLQRVRILKWVGRLLENKHAFALDKPKDDTVDKNIDFIITCFNDCLEDHDKTVRKEVVVLLDKMTQNSNVTRELSEKIEKLKENHLKLFSLSSKVTPVSTITAKSSKSTSSNTKPKRKEASSSKTKTERRSSFVDLPVIQVACEEFENSFPNEFTTVYDKFKAADSWQTRQEIYDFLLNTLEGDILATLPKSNFYIGVLFAITNEFSERNFNLLNLTWRILTSLIKTQMTENDLEFLRVFILPLVLNVTDKKQKEFVLQAINELSALFHPVKVIEAIKSASEHSKITTFKIHLSILTVYTNIASKFGVLNCNIDLLTEACVKYSLTSRKPHKLVKESADELFKLLVTTCGPKLISLVSGLSLEYLETHPKLLEKYSVVSHSNTDFLEIRSKLKDEFYVDIENVKVKKYDICLFIESEDTLVNLKDMAWKIRFKAMNEFYAMLESKRGEITFTGEPAMFKDLVKSLKGRLEESNKNVVTKAILILGKLAPVIEENPKRQKYFLKVVSPSLLSFLSDNKKFVVEAVIAATNQWMSSDIALEFILLSSVNTLCKIKTNLDVFMKLLSNKIGSFKECNLSEECLESFVRVTIHALQSKYETTRKSALSALKACATATDPATLKEVFTENIRSFKPEVKKRLLELTTNILSNTVSNDRKSVTTGSTEQRKTIQKQEKENDAKVEPDNAPIPVIKSKTFKQRKFEQGMKARTRREDNDVKTSWPVFIQNREKEALLTELKTEFKRTGAISPDSILVESLFSVQHEAAALEITKLLEYSNIEGNEKHLVIVFDLLCKFFSLNLSVANSSFSSCLLELIEKSTNLEIEANGNIKLANLIVLVPHLLQKLTDKQKRFRDKTREILKTLSERSSDGAFFKVVIDFLNKNTKGGKMNILLVCCILDILEVIDTGSLNKHERISLCKRVVPLVSDRNAGREVQSHAIAVMNILFEHLNYSKRALLGLLSNCDRLSREQKRILMQRLDDTKPVKSNPVSPIERQQLSRRKTISPAVRGSFEEELKLPVTPPTPKVSRKSMGSIEPKANFLGVYNLPQTPKTPVKYQSFTPKTPKTQNVYTAKTPNRFATIDLPETPKTPQTSGFMSPQSNSSDELKKFKQSCLILKNTTVIKSKNIFEMYENFGKLRENFEVASEENSVVQKLVRFDNFLQFYLPVLTKSALTHETKCKLKENVLHYVADRKSKNLKYTNLNIERVVATLENLYQVEDNKHMVEQVLEGLLSSGYFLGDYCSQNSTLKVFVARYYIKHRNLSGGRTSTTTDNRDIRERINNVKKHCYKDKRRESEDRFNSILNRLRSKK